MVHGTVYANTIWALTATATGLTIDTTAQTWGRASSGAQGAQGVQGPQGAAGSQGSQGSQGTQGPQGQTGSQGTQGNQGNQGSTGTAGPAAPAFFFSGVLINSFQSGLYCPPAAVTFTKISLALGTVSSSGSVTVGLYKNGSLLNSYSISASTQSSVQSLAASLSLNGSGDYIYFETSAIGTGAVGLTVLLA